MISTSIAFWRFTTPHGPIHLNREVAARVHHGASTEKDGMLGKNRRGRRREHNASTMHDQMPASTFPLAKPGIEEHLRGGRHNAFVDSMRCEEGTARAPNTIICEREMKGMTKMAEHG